MNRPIRAVSIFAALMFFALLANVTYSAAFRQAGLNNDPRNARVRDAEFSQNRGDILVGSMPIARTVTTGGQFTYLRTYPKAHEYAPVTGYYSYYYGRSELEKTENAQLTGTADSQWLSRITGTLSGRKPQGGSLLTTINPKAQDAAWQGLQGMTGGVVALDWSKGAVLAMASTPSYDPNKLSTHDLPASQRAWAALDPDSPDSPLLNKAANQIYPPGSTFKLVTAAAALSNGLTPTSMVEAPSAYTLPGTRTKLTNEIDCGGDKITLTRALEISCNTAFAKIGGSLGADKLRDQAEKFGFGSTVDSDVSMVASRFPSELTPSQLALSAIGQYDVATTPLQMAMVTSAVANNGRLMQPYLTTEVRASNLQTVWRHRPQVFSDPMTPAAARQLQQMMVSVVDHGTGQAAQIDGVRVGGKTGTAQSAKERNPYAWFVAFSDNPKVAVAVFIQSSDTERSEIAGGRLAAPIARDVIEALR